MGYVLIGILVIAVIVAGALILRRAGAAPYKSPDTETDTPVGDTTEHSDVSSATHSTATSRRG